jgi:hypothetical protein
MLLRGVLWMLCRVDVLIPFPLCVVAGVRGYTL